MRFAEWMAAEGPVRVARWRAEGMSWRAVGERLGVSGEAVRQWVARASGVWTGPEDWKGEDGVVDAEASRQDGQAAYAAVERALLRHATGFTQTVRKQVKLHRVEYGADGKKRLDVEELVPVEEETYVAPSVTAAVFWLNNRRPRGWEEAYPAERLLVEAAKGLLERVGEGGGE